MSGPIRIIRNVADQAIGLMLFNISRSRDNIAKHSIKLVV